MTEDPRHPIGRFRYGGEMSPAERAAAIDEIAALPARLRAAVDGVPAPALERSYREGGWTIRQLVHHLADSHMQSYSRFRLAMTEEVPVIKPYDEAAWAELSDVREVPPRVSIDLLEALHARWVAFLRALPPEAFTRTVFHPEQRREISLDEMVALYAWHSRHHLAHVEVAKARREGAAGSMARPESPVP